MTVLRSFGQLASALNLEERKKKELELLVETEERCGRHFNKSERLKELRRELGRTTLDRLQKEHREDWSLYYYSYIPVEIYHYRFEALTEMEFHLGREKMRPGELDALKCCRRLKGREAIREMEQTLQEEYENRMECPEVFDSSFSREDVHPEAQ